MAFFSPEPNRGHPSSAPGFSQAQDPFAGLARGRAQANGNDDEEDDAYVSSGRIEQLRG